MAAKAESKSPMRGSPKAPTSGAEYEVLKTSHINGHVVHAGATVVYDGIPGKYLRPINAEAKAVKAKADAIRKKRDDAVVKTETLSGAEIANRELLELSNARLGVNGDEPRDVQPEPSAAEKKALEAAAEQTRKDTLAQSQEAGGVLLQMTGESPETVIPTTGPRAEAGAQEQKATAEKVKGK